MLKLVWWKRKKKNEKDGFKEDHGWVISAVYDAVAKTTFLVLLDAELMLLSLEAPPLLPPPNCCTYFCFNPCTLNIGN